MPPTTFLPSIFAFITFFSSRSLSILSTWPNHLKTFISTLAANSLLTPVLTLTTSFLILSNRGTPVILLRHFIRLKTHLVSVSQLLSYPHDSEPYITVGTTTFSYKTFLTFIPSPLFFITPFNAPSTLHPSFTLWRTFASTPPFAAITETKYLNWSTYLLCVVSEEFYTGEGDSQPPHPVPFVASYESREYVGAILMVLLPASTGH